MWQAFYVMAVNLLEDHLEIICWMEERNLVYLLEGIPNMHVSCQCSSICDVMAIKIWLLAQWALHIHHVALA